MSDLAAKKPTIGLDKTVELSCECGNNLYKEVVMLRTVSKFIAGTSEDGVIPIPAYACTKCEKLNQNTLHPFLRDKK
jgi:hypothetical protein